VTVTGTEFDGRYEGRFGTVASTIDDPGDRLYPHGRVEVVLVVDELWAAAFGGPPPKSIWFRPSDLERGVTPHDVGGEW